MTRKTFLIIPMILIYFYYTYQSPKSPTTEKIEKLSRNRTKILFDHEWTPITTDSENCFIYSAYQDMRKEVTAFYTLNHNSTLIRVISILIRKIAKKNFQCHFKYFNGKNSSFGVTFIKKISESHDGKFSPYFVLCEVRENEELPEYVGISQNEIKDEFVNFVKVSYPRENQGEVKIAVCPGPVFGNYNNALRVAEWIEIYKILGVSKFYIYNTSMGSNVTKLLKFYETHKIVEIFQWNIGDILETKPEIIHHYGLIGALNDCFYHATLTDNFNYFIHADFDEIIFPYGTDSLTEFLKTHGNSTFHSFLFFNYFFFHEYGQDLSNVPSNAVNKFLYTQAQTLRTSNHSNIHERTKFIAKRNSAIEVGNHYIWQSVRGTKEFRVNEKIGALHHYRDNCQSFKLCDVEKSKIEHARKFSDELWKNVDDACRKVFEDGKCPLE